MGAGNSKISLIRDNTNNTPKKILD